jgi:hypothetical protein
MVGRPSGIGRAVKRRDSEFDGNNDNGNAGFVAGG